MENENHETNVDMVKDRIIETWTKRTEGTANGDRESILHAIANDMGIPRSVIAQHISEWEAGKSVQ